MQYQAIKKILMERDGMTEDDAIDLIKDAQRTLDEYLQEGDIESAENICAEFFGLEPDYLF